MSSYPDFRSSRDFADFSAPRNITRNVERFVSRLAAVINNSIR